MTERVWHRGSCHCGRIAFEALAPPELRVRACNCSICERVGYQHLIVPRSRFRLLSGEDAWTEYRFATKVAVHRFCSTCGVKPFYVPRSHPDGISVNARCLDRATVRAIHVEPFDGRNWETSAAELPPLAD